KKVEALIRENEVPFQKDILEVAGYSTVPLYRYFVIENTIDTLILDALKWKMPEVDVVLSNGFRFCPPNNTRDHTGNIPVTQGYIYDMLPVDSTVRKGKVTGKQIMEWLEKELNNVFAKNAAERFGGWMVKFLGMDVRFMAFGEKGRRVQQVKIGGKDLDPAKTYLVSACERDGDPDDMLCRIRGVKEAKNTPFTLHQVMRDYLKFNSPVTPMPHRTAIALDAPESLLTQVTGVDYQFK
ncbi:MAG TPA: 5'-nucleotidase, partial [Saprospiraceae bacterium]|nr:5'-nucleotidase [Saprospiraceae bacterium]